MKTLGHLREAIDSAFAWDRVDKNSAREDDAAHSAVPHSSMHRDFAIAFVLTLTLSAALYRTVDSAWAALLQTIVALVAHLWLTRLDRKRRTRRNCSAPKQ